jgi:HD-GYP domain-containing protein (c-di-GMP phosphodiesterase class II)
VLRIICSNPELEGHPKRVAAFTIAVARLMGIPDEQIRVIARGTTATRR